MAWTIEAALDDEVIENPRKFISEYQFTLRGIAALITIRLYKPIHGEGVEFEQSCYIHTPTQATPYRTSHPWGDDEAYALHLAVRSITQYYNEAVRLGHSPSESWLVPNENFLKNK
jgi:hypothetical protein